MRLCLTSEAQPREKGGAGTESHGLSAHQAAEAATKLQLKLSCRRISLA